MLKIIQILLVKKQVLRIIWQLLTIFKGVLDILHRELILIKPLRLGSTLLSMQAKICME